jgi:hypothetical protein
MLWLQGAGMTYKYSDLSLWKSNFGHDRAVAAVDSVPEPTPIMSALGALLMQAHRRRRRT